MNQKQLLGSRTAKGGFVNEKEICKKFNNWENDIEAQEWLVIMGYNIDNISKLNAIQIPTRISKKDYEKFQLSPEDYEETTSFKKADAQVKLTIKIGDVIRVENISIKKANKKSNFNQIDKRPVSTYKMIWGFDSEIELWLKLFTGELLPKENPELLNGISYREQKRLFLDEIPENIRMKILTFFKQNKITIITDILKGRGFFSAEWMLVTMYNQDNDETSWKLSNINEVINYYSQGNVELTPRGSLKIGRVTLQRKGGTPDPTSLQFKFKPLGLFEI